MKQGSADDPFADDQEIEPADDDREAPDRSAGPEMTGTDASTELATRSRTQRQSLPFIHARDGVKTSGHNDQCFCVITSRTGSTISSIRWKTSSTRQCTRLT